LLCSFVGAADRRGWTPIVRICVNLDASAAHVAAAAAGSGGRRVAVVFDISIAERTGRPEEVVRMRPMGILERLREVGCDPRAEARKRPGGGETRTRTPRTMYATAKKGLSATVWRQITCDATTPSAHETHALAGVACRTGFCGATRPQATRRWASRQVPRSAGPLRMATQTALALVPQAVGGLSLVPLT
jgi:hypothetical protein